MADIELSNVSSGYNVSKVNDNFETIQDELNNNVMKTDGSQVMTDYIDMNSNRIVNLEDGVNDQDAATLRQMGVNLTLTTEQAVIATEQATIATEQATIATEQAGSASASAGSAALSADEASGYVGGVSVLTQIARSLNVADSAVIYSTDTTTELDDVSYIYDTTTQTTYGVPVLNGTGEAIVSASGGSLVTSGGSYDLINYDSGNLTLPDTNTARSIADRFGNVAELEDYADLATGDDWTDALNAALATGKNVRVPPNNGRTFGISVNPTFTTVGQMIFGDNRETTELKAISTTHPTSIISVADTVHVIVDSITFNGNKANRPDVTGGSGAYIRSNGNRIRNCTFKGWPNSGILLNGNTYTCTENHIKGCLIVDNDGVGISQSAATFSIINKNTFARNGLENLTIDTGSYSCKVTDNYFKKHYGGCGCIGWDESNNVIVSNNQFDGENAEDASSGNRVAICWNANTGPNLNGKIQGNSFINYPENGVKLRDRSDDGGFKPGSGVISGNTFTGIGEYDIQIPELSGVLDCKSNGGASLDILADNNLLRLDSAAIKFDAQMSTDATLVGDNAWSQLVMDSEVYSRECEQTLGEWALPVSGTYSFYGKVRFTSLPTDADFISIGIRVDGVTKELLNEVVNGDSVKELTISPSINISAGDASLIARMYTTSGTSTCVINSGVNSSFQCTYIG